MVSVVFVLVTTMAIGVDVMSKRNSDSTVGGVGPDYTTRVSTWSSFQPSGSAHTSAPRGACATSMDLDGHTWTRRACVHARTFQTLMLCCTLVSADRGDVNATLSQNCPAWVQAYKQIDGTLVRFKIARADTHKAVSESINVAFTVLQSAKQGRLATGPFYDLRVAVMSVLFSTNNRIAFHVVTNIEWFAMLENFFTKLASTAFKCCFKLYCVDMASMVPHMSTIGIKAPAALWSRVLLPDILSDVDDIIYLDTDLFMVSDIAELWAVRESMPAHAATCMAATKTGGDGFGRYCSCVMILRLSLLRQLGIGEPSTHPSTWTQTVKKVIENTDEFRRRKETPHEITFVEQKVYSWVGIAHNLAHTLPR